MPNEKRLASFCRLCLAKTQEKVPIFGNDESNVDNLLMLIELNIDPELEPDAVVCYECIVTLEGFFQFKEQCHVNDEYIKTLPPEDSVEVSDASEQEDVEPESDYDLLEVEETHVDTDLDSEEEGRVEYIDSYEPLPKPKRKAPIESQLDIRQSFRDQKATEKAQSSLEKVVQKSEQPAQKRQKLDPPKAAIGEPNDNELPKLRDSYPDWFHFEKSPRSLYFTLVYYGERFNSAVYGPTYTYWQCAYKRKFRCPALVHAANDYVRFERRFEHSHPEQKTTADQELFTAKRALPEIIKICWQKMAEKKVRRQEKLRGKKGQNAVPRPKLATYDEVDFEEEQHAEESEVLDSDDENYELRQDEDD